MATYSLAITGVPASNPQQPQDLILADTVARVPAQQSAMRQGLQFLAKGPDGAQRWYTFDAERSTPALPVLKAVSP
jgi:hypothetical protein